MNYQIILILGSILLAIIFNFVASFKDKDSNRFNKVAKILSVIFFLVYLVRLLQREEMNYINGYENSIFSKSTFYQMIILRMLTATSVFSIVLAPFFDKKPLKNIAAFVAPIVYIFNILKFKTNIYAFNGYSKVFDFTNVMQIEFAIECMLGFALGTMQLVKKIISKDFKGGIKEVIASLITLVVITICAMPYGTLNNIWGETGPIAENFNTAHICLIVFTIALIFFMYLWLRHKSQEDKFYVMSLYTFLMFLQFVYYMDYPFSFNQIPLHVCHTGVLLMTFIFITKNKNVFYYCFFINTFGALAAILAPNVTEPLITHAGIHFWFEHIAVFAIPIICVAIGLFPRPNFKSFVWCVGIYTVYYGIILFMNSYFWAEGANYFFMNDDKIINTAADVFPALVFKDIHNFFATMLDNPSYFTLFGKTCRYYKTYYIALYIGYFVVILIEWLLFKGIFDIADDHYNLHQIKRKKRMDMLKIGKVAASAKNEKMLYPEDKNCVRISHFTKVYNGSEVKSVDDFSLTIHGGEVYGFLGHNGAGKSTTIKSLVGIQTITQGTISVCGFDIEKQAVAAKLNIGYVSDNHAVYEKLTGREYINYVANLYMVPEEERKERFDKYVHMFNLQDAIDREIKGYSHGMKQKIVVIASLMHDPKVWVLDEPLTGLDPTSSFQIKECMRDHANRGNIVFFSSHVIEVVEKICDKICIIGHGKLIGEWDLHELGKQGLSLEELYMKYVATQNLNIEAAGKKADLTVKEGR